MLVTVTKLMLLLEDARSKYGDLPIVFDGLGEPIDLKSIEGGIVSDEMDTSPVIVVLLQKGD